MDELSQLEKSEFESKVYTDFEDQFQILAIIALILLILDFMILERKNRILKKINLFTVDRDKESSTTPYHSKL